MCVLSYMHLCVCEFAHVRELAEPGDARSPRPRARMRLDVIESYVRRHAAAVRVCLCLQFGPPVLGGGGATGFCVRSVCVRGHNIHSDMEERALRACVLKCLDLSIFFATPIRCNERRCTVAHRNQHRNIHMRPSAARRGCEQRMHRNGVRACAAPFIFPCTRRESGHAVRCEISRVATRACVCVRSRTMMMITRKPACEIMESIVFNVCAVRDWKWHDK